MACGGEAGSRLAKRLGMKLSPDTVIRETRCTAVPLKHTPHVLGVDDCAFRMGQRYGTVLVDLEKNCPVDLLPDRDPDSLVSWLKDHPGVEIVSRDRCDCYFKGVTEGVPKASRNSAMSFKIGSKMHRMKSRPRNCAVLQKESSEIHQRSLPRSSFPGAMGKRKVKLIALSR